MKAVILTGGFSTRVSKETHQCGRYPERSSHICEEDEEIGVVSGCDDIGYSDYGAHNGPENGHCAVCLNYLLAHVWMIS